MSKNKNYRPYTNPVDEVAPEEVKEVVKTVNEEVKEKIEETNAKTEDNKTAIAEVTNCFKLNIRKHPVDNQDNIIRVIHKGIKVTVLLNHDTANGWRKVKLDDGVEGFCIDKCLTVID